MNEEEWRNADSGYLNSIGNGDTYVRMQMERILNNSLMNCNAAFMGSVACFGQEKYGNK